MRCYDEEDLLPCSILSVTNRQRKKNHSSYHSKTVARHASPMHINCKLISSGGASSEKSERSGGGDFSGEVLIYFSIQRHAAEQGIIFRSFALCECNSNRLDGNIFTFFDRFYTNFLAEHNFVQRN